MSEYFGNLNFTKFTKLQQIAQKGDILSNICFSDQDDFQVDFIIFKETALCPDSFYKSKCPYVCLCVCVSVTLSHSV